MKNSFILVIASIATLCSMNEARGQWVPLARPTAGNVTCFAKIGQYLFAGTYPGGIFRSSDNGMRWIAVNNGITNDLITCLAVSDSYLFAGSYGGGILLTTNQGASWARADTGFYGNPFISKLFAIGPILFAGSQYDGIYERSTDSGKSWTNLPDSDAAIGLLQCGTNLIGYFAPPYGEFIRSSDSGATWVSLGWPDDIQAYNMIGSGGLILAATTTTGLFPTPVGIYLSTDTGTTWVMRDTGIAGGDVKSFAKLGTNFFALTLNGTSPSSFGIFRSSDSGTSWTSTAPVSEDTNINTLSALSGDLFAGTTAGPFRSSDSGTSWLSGDSGFTPTVISTFEINGPFIYAGTPHDALFVSADSGATWRIIGGVLNPWQTVSDITSIAASGAHVIAGTNDGLIASLDSGQTWDAFALPNDTVRRDSVYAVAVMDSILFKAGASSVMRAMIGQPWRTPDSDFSDSHINAFLVDGTNLFAGTADSGLFLSTDSANSWSNIGLTNKDILSLLGSGTNIFAGTNGGGVFLSTNNGVNRSAINTGLTDSIIHSLAISGSKLFAATDSGIFLSTNMGATWTKINTGLTITAATTIAASDQNVFAGTSGAGIWRRPLSDFSVGNVQHPAIEQILFSSFPNPFPAKTTLTLSMEQSGFAKIAIVNLLGSEVARIYSGMLSKGMHFFDWNASSVTQGEYQCVIQMDGRTTNYPMVIIR